MAAPSKTAQEAESFARARERGHGSPDQVSPPVEDGVTPNELPASERAAAQPEPAPEHVRQSPPRDSKRDSIVARFRESRASSEADEDAAEIRAFANDGLPPEMRQPQRLPEPEPEPEPEPAPDPVHDAPVKRTKVIVRGREMELTDEELLAHAQKALAADDYLGEAKNKLNEVNELLRTTKTRAQPASTPPHTPAPQAGEEDEQEVPTEAAPEHQGKPKSPLSRVVELLQFGDPDEAAAELDREIDTRATTRSHQALQRERLRNETVRSARVLQDFADQNPELANDGYASAAMEKRLFELQREDLVKLAKSFGKDESVVPTNPAQIAQYHLYYRTENHPVRDVPALLKQTKDDYIQWRGKGKSADEPAPKEGAPRVEVVVDRTARRTNIQQQPSRTVAPKPDAQAPAAPRDRSSVVQSMIAARAKPRGKIGVGVA